MAKLFSINEKYSNRIYKKEKLAEFRRQNVNVRTGEVCLIYTSSPIKKITGFFIVKNKIRLPLQKLWEKTKKIAGISKKEFFNYFEGCKEGTAILLKKVKELLNSISLNELRLKIKNFRPPQSYYNVNNKLYNILSNIIPQKSLSSFV
ncbi:hypothetical protein JXB41_03880 [Candidatus Woesearchaeota archaeon]|nr:hypothetical protein [Candidatus Woesearchaeota archaeon]